MGFFKAGKLVELVQTVETANNTTTLIVTSPKDTRFTGSMNQTMALPDATTLTLNMAFTVKNLSTGSITVTDNDETTLVVILPEITVTFYVTDISTAAGAWDAVGNNGTGVTSTHDLNIVYGNDNAGNQTTYGISTGATLDGTVLRRTDQGQAHALTLGDTDANASPNDLVNRAFLAQFRTDRVRPMTLSNGGSDSVGADEDAVIYQGSDVGTFTVNLPTGLTFYKRYLLKFRAAVSNLLLSPGGTDTIDFIPGYAGAGDCIELGYNYSAGDWEVVAVFRAKTNLVFGDTTTPKSIVLANGINEATDANMSSRANVQTVILQGPAAGMGTVTANPQIQAHNKIGAEILLIGYSDTNGIELNTGTGLILNGPWQSGLGNTLSLIYIGSSTWLEKART